MMSLISSVAPPPSAVAPPPGNHGNKNTKTQGPKNSGGKDRDWINFCSSPSATLTQKDIKLFTLGGTGVNAT